MICLITGRSSSHLPHPGISPLDRHSFADFAVPPTRPLVLADNSKMLSAELLSNDAREVILCVNPNAGWWNGRGTVDELIRRLREQDFDCTVCEDVQCLHDAAAESILRKQLRAVVAAGGDGTVSLVLNNTPPDTPILVLPLGTENLLSKYLNLTADPALLARVVADGMSVRLDVGEANGQLFTLMAGCGFDAEVVRRLHRNRRGKIHHLSYAMPILDSILNYNYPELTVYYEEQDAVTGLIVERSLTGRWVFVVNIPRYARGLNLAPQADAADGLVDISVFEDGSLWSGLWYLGGIALGQHDVLAGYHRVRSRAVRVEGVGRVPYQLDGDPGGELPLKVRVLPQRMRLLVSQTWVATQASSEETAVTRTLSPQTT